MTTLQSFPSSTFAPKFGNKPQVITQPPFPRRDAEYLQTLQHQSFGGPVPSGRGPEFHAAVLNALTQGLQVHSGKLFEALYPALKTTFAILQEQGLITDKRMSDANLLAHELAAYASQRVDGPAFANFLDAMGLLKLSNPQDQK